MTMRHTVSLLVAALVVVVASRMQLPEEESKPDITIGVVEEHPELAQKLAAAVEVALINVNVAPVEPDEPLSVPNHICQQSESGGVMATVSTGTEGAGAAAAAAAARVGLPLLLVGPAPRAPHSEALDLYPHDDLLAEACAELCEVKGWKWAVLLAEGGRGAGAAPEIAPPKDSPLFLSTRLLPPPEEDALLRNQLLVLKDKGARNFIVWCSASCITYVLDTAQRVGLLDERHSYILLTVDAHTEDLSVFSHGGANITSFQLCDLHAPASIAFLNAWQQAASNRLDDTIINETLSSPPTSLLLTYDAANMMLEAQTRLQLPQSDGTSCSSGEGMLHAETILNYVRSEEHCGLCGCARWDADGARRDAALIVSELTRGGELEPVGRWTRTTGVQWRRKPTPAPPVPRDSMTNRTFTVLVAQNNPYVMHQESSDRLAGNARYEGFCIELIDKLANILHFNYTLLEQEDGQYGNLNKTTGEWNGMIYTLIHDPSIDFAITDLTITAERESAVDFTTPFMNLGISILFQKPTEPEPETFAFLLPFSDGVWICLGVSYVLTSLLLYVVGRLCPDEWQNPYPCIEEPVALENQFTLPNAFWFNIGAILLQGSEIAPIGYGTRAVASAWWVFALVLTSSYTANLATLLAKKTSTELIHDVRDLVDNEHGIEYGAKEGGSTYTFFQYSKNEMYQKMYQHMKEHKMPSSNQEGIEWVEKGGFAFLMESTTIEYTTERNCEVIKVGDLLDNKGYGLAMKKDSPYRQALNLALLNLQEAGELRKMKHRWWNELHGGGACKSDEEAENEPLKMANFYGLFLVLIVGCALGILIACIDVTFAARRRMHDYPTYWHALLDEIRFVFRFEMNEKALRGPLLPPDPTPPPSSSPAPTEVASLREASPINSEQVASASPSLMMSRVTSIRSRRRSSLANANLKLMRHAHLSHNDRT